MTWKAKIAGLFGEKETNECFVEAKEQLNRLKNNINFINVEHDGDISPLVLTKNKWQSLPCNLGRNVFFMGINSSKNYNLVLNDIGPNGSMYEHSHSKNFEEILVVDGEIEINVDGVFTNLDSKSFNRLKLKPNQKHSIHSTNGARILVAYSKNDDKATVEQEDLLLIGDLDKKFLV